MLSCFLAVSIQIDSNLYIHMLNRAHTAWANELANVILNIYCACNKLQNIFLENPIARHSCIYFIDKIIAMSPCRTFFFPIRARFVRYFFFLSLQIFLLPFLGNAYFASFCMYGYLHTCFISILYKIYHRHFSIANVTLATPSFDQIFSSLRLSLILSQNG